MSFEADLQDAQNAMLDDQFSRHDEQPKVEEPGGAEDALEETLALLDRIQTSSVPVDGTEGFSCATCGGTNVAPFHGSGYAGAPITAQDCPDCEAQGSRGRVEASTRGGLNVSKWFDDIERIELLERELDDLTDGSYNAVLCEDLLNVLLDSLTLTRAWKKTLQTSRGDRPEGDER